MPIVLVELSLLHSPNNHESLMTSSILLQIQQFDYRWKALDKIYPMGLSPCSHTRSSSKFSYPSIIPFVPIGWRRLDHHLKALEQLYRLIVVSRLNINLLSINSTKSTPRKRAARPKSTSEFRNFRRRVSKIAIIANNNHHHRQNPL